MITLHWLYALAGAMFAAFALLSALDRSQPQALRQCRLLGADGAEPARPAICSAISATACWCSASPGSPGFGFIGRSHPPTTSDEERAALVATGSATSCSCRR